jgi:hypothetical protein
MTDLNLIDWRLVAFSGLWVTGLAVALAAFSLGDYEADRQRARTRDVLARPGYRTAVYLAVGLFCLGLLGEAQTWWAQALWAALALASGYQSWAMWRRATAPNVEPK